MTKCKIIQIETKHDCRIFESSRIRYVTKRGESSLQVTLKNVGNNTFTFEKKEFRDLVFDCLQKYLITDVEHFKEADYKDF